MVVGSTIVRPKESARMLRCHQLIATNHDLSGDVRPPNISGSFGYDGYGLMNFGKGAFAMSTKQPKTFGEGQYYDSYDTSFSAKRSSSTYGAASTVQPSSMRLVPCIKA